MRGCLFDRRPHTFPPGTNILRIIEINIDILTKALFQHRQPNIHQCQFYTSELISTFKNVINKVSAWFYVVNYFNVSQSVHIELNQAKHV